MSEEFLDKGRDAVDAAKDGNEAEVRRILLEIGSNRDEVVGLLAEDGDLYQCADMGWNTAVE